jgi:hypothetical protein
MRRDRLLGGVWAFCLVFLATASAAAAANRYASPSGSGTACTQAAPCDIATAINNAGPGDDITIEPGTYTTSTELDDNNHTLTIHGQTGQPRPVIHSSSIQGFGFIGANTSLSDVEIDMSAAGATGIYSASANAAIDRVISRASGGPSMSSNSIACSLTHTATVTNSLCAGEGAGAFGMSFLNGSLTLRNDTLEAPGTAGNPGNSGFAVGSPGTSASVLLSNTIARGATDDINASAGSGQSTTIAADHSNYAAINAGGGGTVSVTPAGTGTNQTNFPQFVNPATGDFHELATSPTVNAGADASVNGALDLDGNPRTFGAATDIGAYEYIPPPTCQPVSATTSSGTPATIQLACTDATSSPLTYAITGNPSHGSVSVDPSTGKATYTPSGGFSGSDSFSFNATSSHGTSAAATASITVTAGSTVPRDSKPKLSPTTFMAFSSGPSIVAAKARGTLISYTDNQSATTVFKVQRAVGTGVISHGKCVKASSAHTGRKCIRFRKVGRFKHHDSAGLNRFRFTGRVGGKKLRPGRYRLISRPVNAAGKAGSSHTNFFTIVR